MAYVLEPLCDNDKIRCAIQQAKNQRRNKKSLRQTSKKTAVKISLCVYTNRTVYITLYQLQ